jgi:hypothetical protein
MQSNLPKDTSGTSSGYAEVGGLYAHGLIHANHGGDITEYLPGQVEDAELEKIKHYLDTRHSRLSRTNEVETTLYHMPRPNRHHLDCLNSLLATVEREQRLSTSDLNIRQAVAQPVHSLLQEHIQGCTMRLYDSSLGGFGLKFANVNLELQITVNRKLRLVLQKRLNV